MIHPDEALQLVLQVAARRDPVTMPLLEACGLELAEPVVAPTDQPPFPRAMMDGVAVRTSDAGKTIPVLGTIAAGQVPPERLPENACYEILTGAPCPPGTEAIVPKEDLIRSGDKVTLPDQIAPGQHIAPRGCECKAGDTVLKGGDLVTPLAVAAIAAFGITSVRVYPRPKLGVITTGDEIVPMEQEPPPGKIRNTNGPMLVALARSQGLDDVAFVHAEDRLETIVEALRSMVGRDIVVLTGGVSVGKLDLVPLAIREYGAEIVFHRVTQKPGKPLLFARRGAQLIFGLPGNPLASHFCFHRYVLAAIRQMCGTNALHPTEVGVLTDPVKRNPKRTWFVTGFAYGSSPEEKWKVKPLPGVSSADVFAACRANCYLEIPPGNGTLEAGCEVRFTWIVEQSLMRREL